MYGRYAICTNIEQITAHFPIDRVALDDATPNYNVAPPQELPALIRRDENNVLDKLHWGLVPFWANDIKISGTR